MRMFRKVGHLIQTLGPRGALLYALQRAETIRGFPLRTRSFYVVAQPVQTSPRLPARRARELDFREIEPDDPAVQCLPADEQTRRHRFDQGARCYGLFRGSELVGSVWLARGGFEEDEVRCRYDLLPAHCTSWDFDIFIRPEWRTGPAFLKLWDETNRLLAGHGVSYTLSRISAFNLTSLRSHERLGARRLGRTDFFRLGPFQFMISDLTPRLHFSIRRAVRPSVRLDVSDLDDACHEMTRKAG